MSDTVPVLSLPPPPPYNLTAANYVELTVFLNDTTLFEGDSALLACVGYSHFGFDITWTYNGETLMNSSGVDIIEENILRGERQFRQSILRLCGLEVADSGDYTCIISNNQISTGDTIQLTVLGWCAC